MKILGKESNMESEGVGYSDGSRTVSATDRCTRIKTGNSSIGNRTDVPATYIQNKICMLQ